MSSSFGSFALPLYAVNVAYLLLAVCGMSLNSLVVVATIQSKSLHHSCNVLIAFCAFCDILHQGGHLTRVSTLLTGEALVPSWTCQAIQTLPVFGISAGSFAVLSIGIDRLFSAVAPLSYNSKNASLYLSAHFGAILLFTGWQYYLMLAYTTDSAVVCIPPEAFHGRAKSLWAVSSCLVYAFAVVVYVVVWFILQGKEDTRQVKRIFRSLFIIMLVVVLGWMLTMSGVMAARLVFGLSGVSMLLVHEAVGLFVNSSLVANYVVYYFTSSLYRSAFKRQLHFLLPFDVPFKESQQSAVSVIETRAK